ncbi:MAG TPA: HAD family hydrolase [Bryobacteraceae bacterium]|nr:HAD family hydrolase [Bryobacteraceae bacterium]
MGIGTIKAVFLDRDGVLNEAIVRDGRPHSPQTTDQLKLVPDALGALSALKAAGFLLIVVTNQPEVARGTQSRQAVEEINSAMARQLPLDAFYTCWHDDPDACPCRKPKPGLLTEAAATWGIDLGWSYLVGDRWRDIDAGAAAGCKTVLIDYHYRERAPDHEPDHRSPNLSDAAEWIVRTAC